MKIIYVLLVLIFLSVLLPDIMKKIPQLVKASSLIKLNSVLPNILIKIHKYMRPKNKNF